MLDSKGEQISYKIKYDSSWILKLNLILLYTPLYNSIFHITLNVIHLTIIFWFSLHLKSYRFELDLLKWF